MTRTMIYQDLYKKYSVCLLNEEDYFKPTPTATAINEILSQHDKKVTMLTIGSKHCF